MSKEIKIVKVEPAKKTIQKQKSAAKPVKRVQTAEGWKRAMLKARKAQK